MDRALVLSVPLVGVVCVFDSWGGSDGSDGGVGLPSVAELIAGTPAEPVVQGLADPRTAGLVGLLARPGGERAGALAAAAPAAATLEVLAGMDPDTCSYAKLVAQLVA